jgi:hypothetical protein
MVRRRARGRSFCGIDLFRGDIPGANSAVIGGGRRAGTVSGLTLALRARNSRTAPGSLVFDLRRRTNTYRKFFMVRQHHSPGLVQPSGASGYK